MMKKSLDQVIERVLEGKPTTHINLMVGNMTPLLLFLSNRTRSRSRPLDLDTIRLVNAFVDGGASLTLANDRGISPFHFLMMSLGLGLGEEEDKELIRLLMRSSGQLSKIPSNARTPLYILMNRFYANGALDDSTTRHPVRMLVHHLLTQGIIREPSSKLAIRCTEAIRADARALVLDILRSTHLDPNDLTKLLFDAAFRGREDIVRDLLDHKAPVDLKTASYTAVYRRPGILRLLLPHILDRKNELLDTFIRSSYNERPDNAVVKQCLEMILDTGAVASPSVMRMLITNNKMHLVRMLHDHGSRLVLPTEVPANPRTYNWVRGEMDRASIIGSMAAHDLPTKKARRNQKLWKSVARQTSTLPRQLALQLQGLFR